MFIYEILKKLKIGMKSVWRNRRINKVQWNVKMLQCWLEDGPWAKPYHWLLEAEKGQGYSLVYGIKDVYDVDISVHMLYRMFLGDSYIPIIIKNHGY